MLTDNVRTSDYIHIDLEEESNEPNYKAFSELVAIAHDSVTRNKYGETVFATIIGSGIDRYYISECHLETTETEDEADFETLSLLTKQAYDEYQNDEYDAEGLIDEIGLALNVCNIELEENGLQKTLKLR